MRIFKHTAFLVALALVGVAAAAVSGMATIPEEDLGQKIEVQFRELAWTAEVRSIPKEVMVYRCRERALKRGLLEDLASEYGLVPRNSISTHFGLPRPDTQTFANEKGDRYVTYTPSFSGFRLLLADPSGVSYDSKTKRPIIENLLTEEQALTRALELLPAVGLLPEMFYPSNGVPYHAVTCSRVGFTDPETKQRKKLCTNTIVTFLRQIGGFKAYGFGGAGVAEFKFVSNGKLASVTWLMRDTEPFEKRPVKDKEAILTAIRNNDCYGWRAGFSCDKLTVSQVELEYYEGNERSHQQYFLPLFRIGCDVEGGENIEQVQLLLPALK